MTDLDHPTLDDPTLDDPTLDDPTLDDGTLDAPVDDPFPVAESPLGGAARRARWERPAYWLLLTAAAVLYLWGLGAGGWANSFYSAAAQAGSVSWKAWFFGASDAAASITVDKPPASLWVMGLSVRLFGLSTWSLLVPQALMGVATVAVVHRTVRRSFSAPAALLAGAVMATTPVAALMFRFDNPDALLTLLMALAAWATLRGIEDGRRRWPVAVGALLGLAFLTKQLQMMLVVPAFATAHLAAGPHRLRRRVADVAISGATMVAAAGWWLAVVELWPADSRPYIGGTQDNSILELTLGYNGLGRLTGDETGSVGGGPMGMWGETGITRLVDGVLGGQIAWLLPAALVGLAAGLRLTWGSPRTDRRRAALIVWGGWLLVTALVFSYMAGIFHEYYTVALAPAIAALVGIGADLLWGSRHHLAARSTLAGAIALSAWWSSVLLGRASDWNPWLAPVVLGAGFAAAIALAIVRGRRVSTGAAAVAVAALLAGPVAWSVETVTSPETGSIVTAGPTVVGDLSGPRGSTDGAAGGLPGGVPGGGPIMGGRPADGGGRGPQPPPAAGRGAIGGAGGLLDSTEVSDEVVGLLEEDADGFTWVAAAVGSNRASGFQLATELPVLPIGGFNGSDPYPTLAEFQQLVADGEIHWFVAGGDVGPSRGGSDESAAITSWVTSSFEATTVDGTTLYELSG